MTTEKEKAEDEAFEFVQIYQSGFVDGYNAISKKKANYKILNEKCIAAFRKRFEKKNINKEKGGAA